MYLIKSVYPYKASAMPYAAYASRHVLPAKENACGLHLLLPERPQMPGLSARQCGCRATGPHVMAGLQPVLPQPGAPFPDARQR